MPPINPNHDYSSDSLITIEGASARIISGYSQTSFIEGNNS